MSLHFEATLDNKDLTRKIAEIESTIKGMTEKVKESGTTMDALFGKMKEFGTLAGAMFAVGGLTDFVRQVATVRGEFQQLEIAFTTMLGNRREADELMRQVAETAAKTPFDLQGVADGAKQLLAYGTASDNVVSTLTMLGDIASGVSAPLNDIVYLYGTTMTQGRMFTQDLRQFQGRGIPIADELAKQFGVAKSEIGELVTAGKVGAKEFREAMDSMARGRFNNLMEEQSKSITGQISNLEDQVSQMFNEIGKSSEGVISTALSGAGILLEHYKEIGEAIAVLVATYGTYRAIMIASVAVQNACRVASLQEVSALGMKTVALNVAQVAQERFNLSVLKNPYVIAAVAITGLGYAIYKYVDAMSEATQANKSLNAINEKASEEYDKQASKIDTLVHTIENENAAQEDRRQAIQDLKAIMPSYNAELDAEGKLIKHNTQAIGEYLQQLEKQIKLKAAQEELEELYRKKRQQEKDLRAKEEKLDRANTASNAPVIGASMYAGTAQGIGTAGAEMGVRSAKKELEETENAIKEVQAEIQGANNAIAKSNATTAVSYESVGGKIKDLTKHLKELKQAESDIRSGRHKVKNITQALEDNAKEQGETEKKLKLLRGEKGGAKASKDKANEAQKQKEEQIRFEREFQRQMADLAFVAEEIRINALSDGIKRAEALRKLQHDKHLEAIKREKEDMLADKGSDPAKVELLSKVKQENLALEESNAERQRLEEDAKAMRLYLIEYGTYQEKRKALKEQADRAILASTTEGERLSIQAKLRIDLSELDKSYGKIQTTIGRLFSDLSEKGAKELRALAKEAEAFQAYLSAGQWQEVGTSGLDQHGLNRKQFEEQSMNPEKLAEVARRTEEIKNKALEASGSFSQVAQGVKELFSAGDNPQKLEKALGSINAGLSKISGGLSFVSTTFSELAEATGSNALKGLADGINIATDAMAKAQQGMQVGAMFGPVGVAIGGVVGGVSSLIGSFAKMKDAKHEREIQRLQIRIEGLNRAYSKLGKEIDHAYSHDASRLIADQDRLLEQKQSFLRQQIREEQAKKKTDSSKIKNYEQEIESINSTLEDNRRKAKDAIFGSDLKSAINDFANAYADAWDKGNDRAESAKDFVRKQIRAMVMEAIKAKTSKPMEAIRDKMREFFSDGIMSASEQSTIDRMALDLTRRLDGMMNEQMQKYLQDTTHESISGSSRGFQTMSQETASELNGRFTAIQQDLRLLAGTTSEIRNIQLLQLGHLEAISQNTRQLYEMNERIDRIERNTRALR